MVCRQVYGDDYTGVCIMFYPYYQRDRAGSDPFWLSDVQCTGEERRLQDCTHPDLGQVHRRCNSHIDDDIGVECIPLT